LPLAALISFAAVGFRSCVDIDGWRILFDHGTPSGIARRLAGHHVTEAKELGWDKASNGDLLNAAEAGFDVLLTTDKNIRYQQNLSGHEISMVVLSTRSGRLYGFTSMRGCWPRGLSAGGAGSGLFSQAAQFGVYLHRLPCVEAKP
jgi:hypothetical protein